MTANKHALTVSIFFTGLLVFTWFIYQPAVSGPFMFDDADNLGALRGGVTDVLSLQQYLGHGNAGPTGRPISKLSFLLNDNNWPSSPDTFKRTNLLIHLLVGVLLFSTLRLLFKARLAATSADWLALFVSAMFLLHPLQVSTVMYVVQRMTQLASLFILLGVLIHCYYRTRYRELDTGKLALMALSLGLCTLLALFSKESGVLLPAFILVIELTIFAEKQAGPLFIWWRRICLWLPSLGILGYLMYLPRWLNSYRHRDFSLAERLLSEPVVLMDYLGRIYGMKVAGLGLFQDDYPVYSSIANPAVALSLCGLLAMVTLAWLGRKKFPLVSFGILWFLVGHLIESTTIALELYFEHRNYLPMVGPVVVFAAMARALLLRVSTDVARFLPLFGGMILALAGLSTMGYASEWSSLKKIIPIWAVEHPDSPRAQRAYAYTLGSLNLPKVALMTLDEAYVNFPEDLSFPIMSADISCAFNLPLRYDLAQLAQLAPEHEITDGLRPALESLAGRLLDGKCGEAADGFHQLVQALEHIGKAEAMPRSIAGFYVLDGNLYVKERKPMAALRSFIRIDQLKPSPDSALRLAELYLLMADFDSAVRFIEMARERDEQKRFGVSATKNQLYQSKIAYIRQQQQQFEARLKGVEQQRAN